MEEFLAYMKIDVEQRMLDHMLETSELMKDKDSIITISSDFEDVETGSVIDLTESQKEETENQCQNRDTCNPSMIEVDNSPQNNNVLKNTKDTQSTSDTARFCSNFNSFFDKNTETDTGEASGVTESYK